MNAFPRGSRVLVRFEDTGPEHLPLEWTGRVVGPSPLPGRIRVQSEYVTWKGPLHVLTEGTDPKLTRIAKDAPIEYHEHRPDGRHIVKEIVR